MNFHFLQNLDVYIEGIFFFLGGGGGVALSFLEATFCYLLISFTNSLDSDQDRQNIQS